AKAENYSHAWLLSHRPIWAAKEGVKGKRDQFRMLNATLQKAWQAAPIPGIELIVAGHTHLFELLSFKEPFPPQAVIGNGGTKLAHKITTELRGQKIGGATVSNSNSLDDFGFAVMEARASGGWSLQLHDSTGQKNLRCVIEERQTNCESH
ncbi:MAG TPA: hypothetical protein VM532_09225, partial [Burkholderiales bacterium]|nr:hypothetical protein [Burkholderiales bacterium]